MLFIFILQEIAKIIFYLSLPVILFALYYKEFKLVKERKNLANSVANRLLELADDEKPIMLKVDQEKLIEKTADEIERRQQIRGRFKDGKRTNH